MARVGMIVWNEYAPDNRVHMESRALLELGHEVVVIALRSPGGHPSKEVMDEVHVERVTVPASESVRSLLSPLFFMFASRRMVAHVKKMALDRIHAHDIEGLYVGSKVAKSQGSPLVYDAHEADYGSLFAKEKGVLPRAVKYQWPNMVENRVAPSAERIIVNNPYNTSKDRFGHPVTVVPFRADPRFFFPDAGKRPERPVGLYIGGITEHKGFYLMLDAWDELRRRGVHVDLQLLGNASKTIDLEEEVTKRSLEGLVHHVPRRPYREVADVIRSSSFGMALLDPAIASYQMTLPNKLHDYLACGVPVIASALPSHRDLMAEYDCGVVVDDLTPVAIADAVEGLLERDPDRLRREALRASTERFPWDDVRKALLEVHGPS